MEDGTRLRQSWYTALDNAQSRFRQLLTSHASRDWKRVVVPSEPSTPNSKGKSRASATPEPTDIALHRKPGKGESIYRASLEVSTGDLLPFLEPWKAVLATPELRKEWDPAVEGAQLLEMLDETTRIAKTNFTLGWPANPRDAVTISRTFNDSTTLIDISTSLPRSPDEPAYLRPSPPYVRSEVSLFAWCIQIVQQQPVDVTSRRNYRLRITCFWQHDLKALWTFGPSSALPQQLSAMMIGLFTTVQKRGSRIPLLMGYGNGVSIERVRFAIDREALTLDYTIHPDEEDLTTSMTPGASEQGLEELHAIRERRRLTRSVECALPTSQGWDMQLVTKASSDEVAKLPWTAHATRNRASSSSEDPDIDKITFSVKHAALPNDHCALKVRLVIELSGPTTALRLNGLPQPVEDLEDRNPSSHHISQSMLQDASSTTEQSFNTQSSLATATTGASSSSGPTERPNMVRTFTERTASAHKSILSRVKRNYIYFSSLLQEPEAKWKRTVEARGVSIAQLDSIDPTLVVYRAEATFVGLSLWDLYAAVVSPGARAYWDKLYDDAVLLEDVNELTELWHFKTKPAWPANGRDMVVLKTVYKSPTTIHVFAFSADDPNLFPHIPPVEPNVIRTQVDLQGWAIEALSPTTTLLTLLEQSDPKGWSNKASIPQQMITAVAGVGDFAIKCGGPPVTTRLEGAKANEIRYDHEKGSFRIEYEESASRRSSSSRTDDQNLSSPAVPVIECELRCDLDTWASSLDIVVDPPPQTVSALRRHRLSSGGGGLWLTITHDAVSAGEERLLALVRRGPHGASKEKGLVMVNGAKVDVDVEDLPEREMKNLSKQKRIKPARIPLDQPPVLGVIRRRRGEIDEDAESSSPEKTSPTSAGTTGLITTSPKFAVSFSRFFSVAVEQAMTTTQEAVAAISPAMAGELDAMPSASKPPMQYALDGLAYIQGLHSRPTSDGWVLVSEKDFPVYRKIAPEISPVIPVHKGEKVIEGVSAEEVASVLNSYDCRKQWDTRFDSVHVFETFSGDAHTAFIVSKAGFPFRDRGFYTASLMARANVSSSRRNPGDPERSNDHRTAIFYVSTSFSPESVSAFSEQKYNSYKLPVGRTFVDGWILETLDPYGAETYAIPSTRCTRAVAVDYAGAIPAAVNSIINATLPKSILAVEAYIRSISPLPFARLPAVGMLLSNKADDNFVDKAWTLRRRDTSRILVSTCYNPGEQVYRTSLLLNGSPQVHSSPAIDDQTPRPGRIALSSPQSSPEAKSGAPPSSSVPTNTSPQPNTSSALRRSRSRDALRSPSIFTTRGEVRHPTDTLVAELIVDSKLYPVGYNIQVRSRIDKTNAQISLLSPLGDDASDNLLPMTYAVYTLPPSPHHSSGLNADRPPRHLLRLLLPTAQYQMSTIQDPLTGETRSAPPKPQWLLDLEEGRAVIDIEIRPSGGKVADGGTAVSVDGAAVNVLSEKESLTSLGREELLDGKASKLDLLSRTSSEVGQLPAELQNPVAIAYHLLSAVTPAVPATPLTDKPDTEVAAASVDAGQDAAENPQQMTMPVESQAGDGASSALLRFFNAYPNPLLRFSSQSRQPNMHVGGPSSVIPTPGPLGSMSDSIRLKVSELRAPARREVQRYPLSTVLIVALIAFLMGSLLRSLLSPADFIYVVADASEIEDVSAEWREIRRLLEVKYIVGGWDFQIAVVRRH